MNVLDGSNRNNNYEPESYFQHTNDASASDPYYHEFSRDTERGDSTTTRDDHPSNHSKGKERQQLYGDEEGIVHDFDIEHEWVDQVLVEEYSSKNTSGINHRQHQQLIDTNDIKQMVQQHHHEHHFTHYNQKEYDQGSTYSYHSNYNNVHRPRYVLADEEVETSLQELDDTVASLFMSEAGNSRTTITTTTTTVIEAEDETLSVASKQSETSYAVLMHRHLKDNMESSSSVLGGSKKKRSNRSSRNWGGRNHHRTTSNQSITSNRSRTSNCTKNSTASMHSSATTRTSRTRGVSLERMIFQTISHAARSENADTQFTSSLIEEPGLEGECREHINGGSKEYEEREQLERQDVSLVQKIREEISTELILKDLFRTDRILSSILCGAGHSDNETVDHAQPQKEDKELHQVIKEEGCAQEIFSHEQSGKINDATRNDSKKIDSIDISDEHIKSDLNNENRVLKQPYPSTQLLPPVETEEEPESLLLLSFDQRSNGLSSSNLQEASAQCAPFANFHDNEEEWEPDFDAIAFPTTATFCYAEQSIPPPSTQLQQRDHHEQDPSSGTTTTTTATLTLFGDHSNNSSSQVVSESDTIFDQIIDDANDGISSSFAAYTNDVAALVNNNTALVNNHTATPRNDINSRRRGIMDPPDYKGRGIDPPEDSYQDNDLQSQNDTKPIVKLYIDNNGSTYYEGDIEHALSSASWAVDFENNNINNNSYHEHHHQPSSPTNCLDDRNINPLRLSSKMDRQQQPQHSVSITSSNRNSEDSFVPINNSTKAAIVPADGIDQWMSFEVNPFMHPSSPSTPISTSHNDANSRIVQKDTTPAKAALPETSRATQTNNYQRSTKYNSVTAENCLNQVQVLLVNNNGIGLSQDDSVSVSSPSSVIIGDVTTGAEQNHHFAQIVDRCPSNRSSNQMSYRVQPVDTKCSF